MVYFHNKFSNIEIESLIPTTYLIPNYLGVLTAENPTQTEVNETKIN